MAVVHLVQHTELRPGVRDPSLEVRRVAQATRAAKWLAADGTGALYATPRRDALVTAGIIAATCGLAVFRDDRLRDRLQWDEAPDSGADRERTTADRDYHPADGESSRQAGERLRGFLESLADDPRPVAAVTFSDVTVDLLRTLLGDDAVPEEILRDGLPGGSVTTVDGLRVVRVGARPRLHP